MTKENKTVLIIGIAGGLAQIFAKLIQQQHPTWKIIGVDTRRTQKIQETDNLKIIKMKYSRGNFESTFRENQFDYVYHLGRISHSSNSHKSITRRLDLGVMGTNRILDLCLRFKVKKVITLSTFHVYGALSDNSIFLNEEAPLKASIKYPELRDVVEMDQICTTWMWKYQNEIESVLLRPCNIIGSQISNSISRYLVSKLALRPVDFNPVFQFIHEFDMAMVLLQAIDKMPTGIYNVATDDFITLREALDVIESKGILFPITAASALNKILKITKFDVPEYLIDYLKFSCLIDNSQLKKCVGENFNRFKIRESLKLLKV